MNTNDNGRAEARSRANHRLRRMTIGTAMLGVVATSTLGWLAGATNDGATSTGAETAIVTDSTSASTGTAATTATASDDHDDQPHGDDDDGHRPRIERRLLR